MVGACLAVAEVHQPGTAVAVDEDVGPDQVAMGDARGVEEAHLPPRLAEQLVVDLLRVVVGKVAAGHLLQHDHRARAVPTGQRDIGSPDAGGSSGHGHRGLVLGLRGEAGHRVLVTHLAQREHTRQPEEPVGVPRIRVEHLHEQPAPVAGDRTERVGAASRDPCRAYVHDVQPEPPQHVLHARRLRVRAGCAHHRVHCRPDEPADREAPDDVEREVDTGVDAAEAHHPGQDPDDPAPSAGQVGRDHRRHGRRDGHVPGDEPGTSASPLTWQVGQEASRPIALDEVLEHPGADPGTGAGDHQGQAHPDPPGQDRHGPEHVRSEPRPELHDRPEQDDQHVRQVVDQPEDVSLDHRQMTALDRQHRQDQQRRRQQHADQVTRMPMHGYGGSPAQLGARRGRPTWRGDRVCAM